jgi:hypothetical protein
MPRATLKKQEAANLKLDQKGKKIVFKVFLVHKIECT